MDSRLFSCMMLCLLGAGPVEAEVKQTPRQLIKARGQKVTLNCTPDSGHNRVFWYQQNLDQGLQFLFDYYRESQNDKGNVPDRFSAHQFSDYRSELSVSALELEDSAVYLCASSSRLDYNEQYFGQGTRLTVLEDLRQVTIPKVTLFEPSEAEIAKTQKATLVCLATGFYPDHVELSWWVNGKEVHNGVSTDPQPFKEQPGVNGSKYCLSSRLRVSAAFWHNPRNYFHCQVQFYGIADEDVWSYNEIKPVTQNISAGVWGKADCGFTSASYQQGVLSATMLYEILLGKATLYAVLVSALVLMAMVKKKNP